MCVMDSRYSYFLFISFKKQMLLRSTPPMFLIVNTFFHLFCKTSVFSAFFFMVSSFSRTKEITLSQVKVSLVDRSAHNTKQLYYFIALYTLVIQRERAQAKRSDETRSTKERSQSQFIVRILCVCDSLLVAIFTQVDKKKTHIMKMV